MTVRIITPGKTDVPYQAVCHSCTCRFSFEQSDAKLISDQREGDYYTIKCPYTGCHAMVNVDADLTGWDHMKIKLAELDRRRK